MPSAGLAALAQILGQSFAGLPKGMAEAEDMQVKEQDRALRERGVGLQQQQLDESKRQFGVTHGPLDLTPLTQVGADLSKVDPRLAPLMATQLKEQRTAERQRAALDKAAGLYGVHQAAQGTNPLVRPDTSGPLGDLPPLPPPPTSMPTKMDIVSQIAQAGPGAAELAKLMFPESESKPTVVPRGSSVLVGGQWRTPPHPPAQQFTPPAGYKPSYSVNAQGETATTWKADEPKEGERRAAEIRNYLVNVRGLTPGTPQYETEFMNWRNRPLTIFPGGEGFKMTDFMGGAGTPPNPGQAPTAPRPTVKVAPNEPAVGPEQATNLADFRTLLEQLDKVEKLYKEGASQYVGPVTGRLGAARTVTGVGATEGEADFRSELASIQNSIIYLKSGKQINEAEYERLKRELPDPNDPDPVFIAKLRRSRTLLRAMLANREAEFKARGYRGASPPNAGGNAPPPARPGVEALSRRDPRYRQARDRGLTDEQIEQRFGIRLVWD